MSQAYRRYYTGNAFSEKAPTYSTSGDYYDRMEAQLRARQFNPGSDFKSQQSGGSSTTATGHDTNHALTSRRSEGALTPVRTPSPAPPHIHRERRSNTPDSFAVRQYLQAAEDAARLAPNPIQHPPPVSEAEYRSRKSTRLPSFSLPSLSKLRIPKKEKPPRVSIQSATPIDGQQSYEMQISQPMNREDVRFHDRPIGERVVLATERPPSPREQEVYYDGYVEVPLRSGKSTLYGY